MKYCSDCGNRLPPNHGGQCCPLCQEKVNEKHEGLSQNFYGAQDMMAIFDFMSEEQVRRLSRQGKIPGRVSGIRKHRFVRKIVDKWIEGSQPMPEPGPFTIDTTSGIHHSIR